MYKARAFLSVYAGLLGLALLLPRPSAAAWPTNPLVNVPLCTAPGNQYTPTSVTDGAGGAIVAWTDSSGTSYDIYAQRISADGTPQWAANGVALCTAAGEQYAVAIVADGAGGAVVTWYDNRSGSNYDIYAQRISSAGAVQWAANGVALCTVTDAQWYPASTSDGTGGAIVTWQDGRSGTNDDIYAQRISGTGTVQWAANGVALCTATGDQWSPTITSDGAGGAIVTWYDWRSDYGDIYAQRISAAGAVQWTANGVALCTATNAQWYPTLVADGASGAIVVWSDSRNDTGSGNWDLYVQRVSAAGAVQWTANGVALCTATGEQWGPNITSDGAGGAIVVWYDQRSGSNYDVYVRKISAAGAVQWTANGVALCTAAGDQYNPVITSDGAGGAIVAWMDERSGTSDIYARRILAGGTAQWTANGVTLCTATGKQEYPSIVPDAAGGAIVAWHDRRSGTNYDIYAQRVDRDGALGNVDVPDDASLAFALEPVRPNPARGGAFTVRFSLQTPAPARLELLDVAGRRIVSREVSSLGAGGHTLDLGEGRRFAPGCYLVRLTEGSSTRVTRVVILE